MVILFNYILQTTNTFSKKQKQFSFQLGNLHLVDMTMKTPLRRLKTISGLHSGKVTGIETSLGGIVTCSSDSKVK
jgi:hypothetical protein